MTASSQRALQHLALLILALAGIAATFAAASAGDRATAGRLEPAAKPRQIPIARRG